MPELPEVETIKRQLGEVLVGLTITDFWLDTPKMVIGKSEELIKTKVVEVRRRAKLIEIDLNNGRTVLIHLKMTGQLLYQDNSSKTYQDKPLPPLKKSTPNKSTHVIFTFDNGAKLYFNDLRKFGYIKILRTNDVEHTRILSEFGPEPFDPDLTLETFITRLKKRKTMKIKQLLLDQKFLAGVGNIYANEALFKANIDPRKKVAELSEEQMKELFKQVKNVLEVGIKAGGASDQTYVNAFGEKGKFMDYAVVYRRKGKPCETCGAKIERIALGGRGTFFCPKCQL